MTPSLMYSPAWSIKDARFFTERIISQEKVSSPPRHCGQYYHNKQ